MTTGAVAARPSRASALARVDERIVWALLAALLVFRILLAHHLIDEPGLQYDETLFVKAATLRLPGVGIVHSVAGIPIMIYPFTGALKSWLYYPIFKLFGTSPGVVQLPAVVAVSVGLGFLYFAVRDLVNRPVAILVFVVLCFDSSVLAHPRRRRAVRDRTDAEVHPAVVRVPVRAGARAALGGADAGGAGHRGVRQAELHLGGQCRHGSRR